MYFLTEDERRYLLRRLLPEARKIQVDRTLRGWHWADIDAPARPTYDAPLGVWEVAERYCRSGRDVYVRRVLGQHGEPTREMQEGAALHAFAAAWVTAAKRLVYSTPPALVMEALPRLLDADDLDVLPGAMFAADAGLAGKMEVIRRFETYRLLAGIQEALARQPDIGADALAGTVLPVVVEQRVDGRYLGLSAHLAIDAMLIHGPMVLDLKFGPREDFHRLGTTGYALALESVFETPVDLGCVLYVGFRGDSLVIDRDFHFIDDELRTRFIDERDQKQRLVEEELDPGLPDQCYDRCPHLRFCGAEAQRRASQKWPPAAARRLRPANRPSTLAPLEDFETDYVPPSLGPLPAS
ncbi:MAG TPA: type I-A CRISPR-associated protein Cas4/Csa1 [Chloroflexota bacterium]|nr:type I-A CRISPR-associated protein Cas4/Csa1 [Chloroflexota bacterium]